MIFENEEESGRTDGGDTGSRKRRNYTPDHRPHAPKPEPVESVLPAQHEKRLWAPADHRGPLPGKPAMQEFSASVIVPSHALQSARRMKWLKLLAGLIVLALVVSGLVWTTLAYLKEREQLAGTASKVSEASPKNPLLASGHATGAVDDAEIAEARAMLTQRIFPANSWEDWLPHVRQRELVEPMMRGYYAKHAFASFARVTCGQAQAVANERGRFVAFLLEPDQNAVAMVEISDQGPKVDWEILVNYPAVQWKDFLAKRPAGEQDLAVTISRCYVREDFLAKEEKLVRDQLLGLRIGLPGSDDQLFAAIPVDSEPGRWIVAHVPWEHENKSAPVRARLAFDPSHAAMPERVVIGAIPVTGWTR